MSIVKMYRLEVPGDDEQYKLNRLEACNSRSQVPTALPCIQAAVGGPHVAVVESSNGGVAEVHVLVVRENSHFSDADRTVGQISFSNLLQHPGMDQYLGRFLHGGIAHHAFSLRR